MTRLHGPRLDERIAQHMGITEREVERRLALVGFDREDADRLRKVADAIATHAEELSNVFFGHLQSLPEARGLMQNADALESARLLKRDHIRAMVSGSYGLDYVEERLRLGTLYARAGLDPRVFMSAFCHLINAITARVANGAAGNQPLATQLSLQKLSFFDLSLIVDVIVFERERVIHQQQEAISELSTPVLQVRDRLLILPIIGMIDTMRARQVTEALLHAIRLHRAKVVVMDITGVPVVDSKVANHLMQTVMAARLMGTVSIVTGLSADVAQALVTLGVSLGEVRTAGDLQGGLEEAERLLGYRLVQDAGAIVHSTI